MPSAPARHDDVTEPIPRTAPCDTRELPAVGTGPLPATGPTDARLPTGGAAEPPAPTAQPVERPAAAVPRRRGRMPLVLAGIAGLAIVAGATAGTLTAHRAPAPAPSGATSAAPVHAELSSVDPSGGSGLRRTGDGWRTQTYRTSAFGGLKPGVGLLLDLGAPRPLASVRVGAAPAGSTLSLHAADDRPTSTDGTIAVGGDVTASGPTTFDASKAGTHRYWLVWVSSLGGRGDGYGVTLSDPVVTASAG